MNSDQSSRTYSAESRPGWDTRTWKLAAVFCVAIAVCIITAAALERHSYSEIGVASSLIVTSIVMSLFVCPAILAIVARRLPLLWAYLPWLALIIAFHIATSIWPAPTVSAPASGTFTVTTYMERIAFWMNAVFVLGPLVSASPICLFRVFRRRARTNDLKRRAEIDEAIHKQREGSWPPAASGIGQDSDNDKTN